MLSVGDDLESPYLSRDPDVGAAAQLAREAVYLDDAHEVCVLLTEEHHRPEVTRLLQRGRVVAHGLVLGDLAESQLINSPKVRLAHPASVPIVEAQAVRPDVAAGLDDVLAQDGP